MFTPPGMAMLGFQTGPCAYPHVTPPSSDRISTSYQTTTTHTLSGTMAQHAPPESAHHAGPDHAIKTIPRPSTREIDTTKPADPEALEVFQRNVAGVEFRTVSWQRATVVFLKINFAMSILTTPSALASFGAVGGGLALVAWIVVNTCMCSSGVC